MIRLNPTRLAMVIGTVVTAQAALVPLASAMELEEIVITARKRVESLQDVPVAVTAFSGDMMSALGVEDSGDIALYTANFTWNTEFGRASPQPYLRGIGTNNFMPINTGPIAVYQDGVFIGPNIAQGFATFDLERAEVLKGPQGTLYGRNSTGGLINFISVKPEVGAGTNGFVLAEIGEFSTTNLETAIGFDIGDAAAGRIAIMRNLNEGTYDSKNPAVSEANVVDDVAYRATFVFEPSNDLSVMINTHYGKAEPDTAPFKQIGLADPTGAGPIDPDFGFSRCQNPGLGSGCTDAWTGTVELPGIYDTAKNADFEEVTTYGGYLQLEYDFNNTLSLTSITSIDYAELARLDDADDTITQLETDHYYDEFDFYSQELRLSGEGDNLNWHMGAYYYDESNEGILAFTAPIWEVGEGNAHAVDTTSYAFFGQADWDVTDKVRLGAGLRWSYEEKDVKRYQGFATNTPLNPTLIKSINDPSVLRNTIASGTTGAVDFSELTGRISIDYTTDAGNLIYASLSRGFKGGDVGGGATFQNYDGIDAARSAEDIAAFRVATEVVDPEILDALEVGIKSNWLDDNLRVNGAIFYYDYQDQQQTVLSPVPGSIAAVASLSNAGRSKFPGAELEVIYTPTENWFLRADFGFLDATFDEFKSPVSFGEDFSGNQAALTPDFEFSGLARYDLNLDDGAVVAFQVTMSYKDSTFFQPSNDDTFGGSILQEDSETLWNARVSYTAPDSKWEAALAIENLTDEEYFSSGFDVSSLGYVAVKAGPQRYVGASLRYSFGE